jgi:dihydroxy-acid dehydratase
VRDGDMIRLDVAGRRLEVEVEDSELARRSSSWSPPGPAMSGGYQRLYVDHVMQADRGADLDFLVGCRGAEVPQESH